MRLAVPAGRRPVWRSPIRWCHVRRRPVPWRSRRYGFVLAGIFVLGWLSTLGSAGPKAMAASGPLTGRASRQGNGPASRGGVDRTPAHGSRDRPGSAVSQGAASGESGGSGRASAGAGRQGSGDGSGAVRRRADVVPVAVRVSGMPPFPDIPVRWRPAATRDRRPVQGPAVDCRKAKCVALTFDDGPGPYTRKLLAMLAAHHHTRVTFFLIGRNIRGREDVVRQEVAQGHAIGDHTWNHPDLPTLPKKRLHTELARTLTEITHVTGRPVTLMRPPYGATGERVRTVARKLGLAQIIWDVDTDDWRDRNSAIVTHRAVSRARRGDIILMHDIHPTTVRAVPKILRGLAKRGFTFVTVPELLAAHPLKPGRVYFHGG